MNTQTVRTIHHFACTGGTLISKCIAAMPNVVLLSEIDPLSTMKLTELPKDTFWPSDVIYSARRAFRPIDDNTALEVFEASIAALRAKLATQSRALVLRDHAHSHFCTEVDPESRPNLKTILMRKQTVQSILTLRHPLDSFLSLTAQDWATFSPFSLDEYAKRYLIFLDQYAGVATFRYEDFLQDHEAILSQICAALDLEYRGGVESHLSDILLTGDSGRQSNKIGFRERRPVPEGIKIQAAESERYHHLCEVTGYHPETDQTSFPIARGPLETL